MPQVLLRRKDASKRSLKKNWQKKKLRDRESQRRSVELRKRNAAKRKPSDLRKRW